MADALAICHRPRGRARQYGADGAALVKHQAQQEGENLRGSRSPHQVPGHPLGEDGGTAGLRPDADQPAEAPQVHQQNFAEPLAADGWYQVGANHVPLAADKSTSRNPQKQRGDHLARDKAKRDAEHGRKQRPDAEILAVRAGVNEVCLHSQEHQTCDHGQSDKPAKGAGRCAQRFLQCGAVPDVLRRVCRRTRLARSRSGSDRSAASRGRNRVLGAML